MKVYAVGGWVRDRLLGRPGPGGDRDWVVVGATPQQMIELGYRAVGRDFPVFLHPQTHEEYALARTERKSAPGYRGFVVHASPEVTLEQDLARRDLTINAMAMDEAGGLVDPYGGERDLRAGLLRHVGPAFVEDPVRILRLARFAARFDGFRVAPETLELARRMVDGGEADALVPERAWQEVARGLMEATPSRMIDVLRDCGLLARWLPGLRPDAALSAALSAALDRAASMGLDLPARFAVLAGALPDAASLDALLARLRADQDSATLARTMIELRGALDGLQQADPVQRLRVLERADAIRRPERFERLLQAAHARGSATAPAWRSDLQAVRSVDAAAVAARHGGDGGAINAALRRERLKALEGGGSGSTASA